MRTPNAVSTAKVISPEMIAQITSAAAAEMTAQVLAALGFAPPAKPVAAKPSKVKLSAQQVLEIQRQQAIKENEARQAEIVAQLRKPTVPEFIVRRAQNREVNVQLAKACYEAGWTWNQTHDVDLWAKARTAMTKASSRPNLVSLLYEIVH